MEAIFSRHARAILSFSGGKDSLAVLHLLRDWWPRMDVVWVNTGDAFPETIEQMDAIRRMVPRFVELRSDQPAQIAGNGWPVEVVPITHTPIGQMVDGHDKQLFQPYYACCNANVWAPMAQYVRASGATLVIRGTRVSDARKSFVRSGDVVDGVEYWHPIEGWKSGEVFAYLQNNGHSIPAHYAETETSLDCQLCTAYLYENAAKMRYMQARHKAVSDELQTRLKVIHQAIQAEVEGIEKCLV